MDVSVDSDGLLQTFSVPYGSRLEYAQLNRPDVQVELWKRSGPENAQVRLEQLVLRVYDKIKEQPLAYGTISRLCNYCGLQPGTDNEVYRKLQEIAKDKHETILLLKVRSKNSAIGGLYLALQSKVDKKIK